MKKSLLFGIIGGGVALLTGGVAVATAKAKKNKDVNPDTIVEFEPLDEEEENGESDNQ